MSKINQHMISQIIVAVGGTQNIRSNGNCMTRLRLGLFDNNLTDYATLKAIDGVMGVVDGDNQLQIILGPGKAQTAKDLVEVQLHNS